MVERESLIVALIAFVAACVCIALRSDCSLFVFRGQFSLSTLLIVLALGPPAIYALYRAPSWRQSLREREEWIVKPHYLQERGFIGGPPRKTQSTDEN